MQDLMKFKYKEREAEFRSITGVVVSTEKRNDSYTTSRRRGYVNQDGNYVPQSPAISNYSVEIHDFWLKTDEGDEISIQLRDMDIPLREGHNVTMLLTKKPGYEEMYAALINKTTNRYNILASAQDLAAWTHLYKAVDPIKFLWLVAFTWLFFCISIYLLSLAMVSADVYRAAHASDILIIATVLTCVFVVYRIITRTLYRIFNIKVENLFLEKVTHVCKNI